jgi:ubiquinone/menaquinone biosynthesis methyltransferase
MLMLAVGRPIAQGAFVQGDALHLPLADGSVTLITCAFGIRNFQNLEAGFREMHRVLRGEGRAILLEFSLPRRAWLRAAYLCYINRIMPWVATCISRDRSGAYRYLPRSVVSFHQSDEILAGLRAAGFSRAVAYPQTFGVVTIYVADRAGFCAPGERRNEHAAAGLTGLTEPGSHGAALSQASDREAETRPSNY